jgi:hypothetical protein
MTDIFSFQNLEKNMGIQSKNSIKSNCDQSEESTIRDIIVKTSKVTDKERIL